MNRRSFFIQWIFMTILLASHHASASSNYFAEGGRGILDDEEESIRQALEKRNLQADKRSNSGVLPPQQVQPEQEEEEAKPEKRGQIEYASFLEPEPIQNSRQVSRQEADIVVKRAEGSPFLDEHEFITKDLLGALSASITIVVGLAGVAGVAVAGTVWYRMNKQREQAAEAQYPQYGGTGPALPKKGGAGGKKKKSPTQAGDASLAYSAQLHHFEQTKQKILSQGQGGTGEGGAESEEESDGENEEGDYSVYECPGLAPTGDIEVSNPLFENSSSSPKDKESKSRLTEGD